MSRSPATEITSSAKSTTSNEMLRGLYSQMCLIRRVESKFLEYYSRGAFKGTVHTCLGQEACAVGVMTAINRDIDVVFSSHRAHGHFLAYGGPVEGLVAEVFGKPNGVCRGIGGTQHLHWNNMYTTGIQGGIVGPAIGAALAEKLKKSNALVAVFIGDGTMGQGTVYEAFNISSLWRLPILFVLENNKYAQTTPVWMAHAGKLEDRAKPFGVKTVVANGNEAETVLSAARASCDFIRANSAPLLLVLDTYRLGPHSKGDDLRPKEEIEARWEQDPIQLLGMKLSEAECGEIESEVENVVSDVFERVTRS